MSKTVKNGQKQSEKRLKTIKRVENSQNCHTKEGQKQSTTIKNIKKKTVKNCTFCTFCTFYTFCSFCTICTRVRWDNGQTSKFYVLVSPHMFFNVFFNSKQHLSKTLFTLSTPSVVILMICVNSKIWIFIWHKKKS